MVGHQSEPDDYGKPTDGFERLTTSLESVDADLGTTETPIDRFFVCSASSPPDPGTDGWTLTIDGDAVAAPVTVDFERLATLAQVEVTAWLECAGNGRSLFALIDGMEVPRENARTNWRLSGMGLARWRGPRLADVLNLADLSTNAAFVAPAGIDIGNTEGEPARMCLPLDKALDEATVVPAHGAPVRLLVPGWVGAYSVKWLGGLRVSSEWIPSWRADNYYVHRTPDSTITGPITAHPVKSSLALPYPATLDAGCHDLMGYARSGEGSITSVEWSIDDGPWTAATLDQPEGEFSWTVFHLRVDLEAGEHIVRTRATDASGAVQPEKQPFHPFGVLWRSIIPHRISCL